MMNRMLGNVFFYYAVHNVDNFEQIVRLFRSAFGKFDRTNKLLEFLLSWVVGSILKIFWEEKSVFFYLNLLSLSSPQEDDHSYPTHEYTTQIRGEIIDVSLVLFL